MHFRARAYDPRLGRFVQIEPTIEERAEAHYAYTSNHPTWVTDPSGASVVGQDQMKEEEVKPVRVNVMFGEGAAVKNANKIRRHIVTSLNRYLRSYIPGGRFAKRTRFGVEFLPGSADEFRWWVPGKFDPGSFTKYQGGQPVPGTYRYSAAAIVLTNMYGTSKDANEITFFVVASLPRSSGTTVTSEIQTLNRRGVCEKEIIFLDEADTLFVIDKDPENHLFAHEVVHLAGLPDDPPSRWLNGYGDRYGKDLKPEHEKKVGDYFRRKTARYKKTE